MEAGWIECDMGNIRLKIECLIRDSDREESRKWKQWTDRYKDRMRYEEEHHKGNLEIGYEWV